MKKVILVVAIIVLIIVVTSMCAMYWANTHTKEEVWRVVGKYFKSDEEGVYTGDSSKGIICPTDSTSIGSVSATGISMETTSSAGNIGLATGGAKNVKNFRENIKDGYFPISTDITYNGLFYDYYFDTGMSKNKSNEMFSPSYSIASSKDPVSGKMEYYMTVGLNSNIKKSDFKRKKLNLVVVMDISGSMSSKLNSYYYDKDKNDDKNEFKTKMELANESLNLLIDELREDDRLGIVLFDNSAYISKKMSYMGETNIEELKSHILDIKAEGGTNFSAGYSKGTTLFEEEMLQSSEYENRIIVITDAMPNMGVTSKDGLASMISENANHKIYTTFIGVGVDFNTDVVESLTNVKGANYYAVHSGREFNKIMSEDFEYMVTPLVFDLELDFMSDYFEIDSVYGTDSGDKTLGTIMHVNTLFASNSNASGENKGGVILLKLKNKVKDVDVTSFKNNNVKLTVSYKDRYGIEHSNIQDVEIPLQDKEHYDNTGIRKAILLTRYANLMKNWILYERSDENKIFEINLETGIINRNEDIEPIKIMLGEFERTSVKLNVSNSYKKLFSNFKTYMESEIKEINDSSIEQELDILEMLSK